ncbi:hypothetical protein [Pseudomonas zhanjiangensis]|uniref:Uncharacterized protein n=1 Tax=Pseudomonas zhanjiangensis TaxID=3239015 RepID=A0ABV3YRA9_9PSED
MQTSREKAHEYTEVMLSIRHYSTLRFAMLGLYSGAISGLVIGQYAGDPSRIPAILLPMAGILVTGIFFWLEVTLDGFMTGFAEVAKGLRSNGHWEQRSERLIYLVRIPLRGIYVLVFAYWVCVLWVDLAVVPKEWCRIALA